MGDVTYSVKLDEELKKRITQFVKEAGVTGKEFFAELLEIYELEKKSEGNSYAAHLKEFDDHLKRMRALYRGLLDETRVEIESIRTDFERELGRGKEKNEALLRKNEELQKKVKELSFEMKELKGKNSALQNELDHFKNSIKTQEELIKEYKAKLEAMKERMNRVRPLEEENRKLKAALEDVKKYVDSLQKEKELLEIKVENLRTTIDELRKRHSSEMEALKSKGEYEKETALAKEKQRCQSKIEEVMNGYIKREEELSRTIRTLYSQLDALRETLLKEKSKKKEKNSR